jgi:HAMP domain-containing protein
MTDLNRPRFPEGTAGGPADPERTQLSTGQWSIGSLPGRPMASVAADGEPMPAKQVGRYQILAKLGEGAMATVYRAHDPSIDRPLVLKFLHSDLCAVAEYRARFLREARAAGMLAHPNIVTVYDVGEIEGRPYIAMELLNGGPLNEKLVPGEGLPIRNVLQIGMQIANALDYAHSKGIFHRDVKPSNIIAVEDGRTVKIADFGIAQIESVAVGDQTRAGTIIGTPHYMSPEQAMGTRVDGRADIFSVGVMLYQLLTGVRPFEADSMVTLVYRIAKEDAKPINELRKDCPPALRRIVERCLAKAPDARFQTGRELADALAKVWREIDKEGERQGGARRIPLKLKLAIGMTVLVAATMAVTSAFVTHRQYQTMLKQAVEQGASLTKLIAVESAASALSEDWVGIDVLVQEVRRELDLDAIAVMDRKGVVRVSSVEQAVGKLLPQLKGDPIPAGGTGIAVHRTEGVSGAAVFSFQAPITFQGKSVGEVYLTVPEEPLAAAARQSWLLLLLLLVTTAATVGLATYLLVERYSKPLQLLRESLDEIAMGRMGYRIREQRDDEFGEVFRAFDAMAERLDRDAQARPAAAPGTPAPDAAKDS